MKRLGMQSLEALAEAVGYSLRTLRGVKYGEVKLSRFMRDAINKAVSVHTKMELEKTPILENVKESYAGPRSRLKTAREQAGMSIGELSKATGYQIGVLQALEDGGARISEKCADKLASVLPISAEDLLGGGESLRVFSDDGAHGIIGQRPNMTLENVKARYVPLLSFAQAGRTDLGALDEGWTGEAFIAFDVADPKAFALRIEGDSMVPAINPGDVVIASPASSIRRGDEVVVRTIDGECFCKLWGGVSGDIVTLSSHNPLHKSFTLHQQQIAWVYPVVQTSKTRR